MMIIIHYILQVIYFWGLPYGDNDELLLVVLAIYTS